MGANDIGISNAQIARWVLVAFAIILGFFALWLVKDIVMLTLMSVIIAILLTTPVRFFVRHGFRRWIAVLVTMLLIGALIVLVTALVLPGLLEQFRILVVQTIPIAWDVLQHELEPQVLTTRFPFLKGIDLSGLANQLSQQLVGGLGNLTGQVFPFLGNLMAALISILIILFLSVYFIADPGTHWRGALRLVPVPYRPRAREILAKLDLTLRRFLQAQIVLMLLTGITISAALGLLHLPLAGALGVITGLFSFVPNFGPLIALIPILAVAIINSPENVLLLLLIFFIVQFVLNQVIAPVLFGQEVHLAPAVILLSQIVAGIFFGFLGLLLSVPLAAIATVLVREIYVRDILGDTDVGQRRTSETKIVPESVWD